MPRYLTSLLIAFIATLIGPGAMSCIADELPIVKGKKVVATVQGDAITLDELTHALAPTKRAPAQSDRSAELAVLNRMIHVMLVAQEARRMGLDKVPEVRRAVESETRTILRQELVDRVMKTVKVDPNEVERLYQASVRQWEISAALFADEDHAKRMVADLNAGKSFSELASTYRAVKLEERVTARPDALDPAIGRRLSGMAVGDTSPVISTTSGFVIVKLEGVHYPDDPGARAKAEQTSLTKAQNRALTAFGEALKKKYAKVNTELLDRLDYESGTPGFDALLKDPRVLATVKGEKPVTVGDLTEGLKYRFYHGTAMAAEQKRLNAKKEAVFDGLLHRKLMRKEALRLGLDKSVGYRSKVRDFENSVLFEAAVRKVVAPGVKLRDDDVKTYYEANRASYTTPEMIKIKSLVFGSRVAAQSALESLKGGADFQWVANRAEGRLDPNTAGVLSFDDRPVMTSELPDGVRKALAAATPGDARLYTSPEHHVYVLRVDQLVPAVPRPFDEVKGEIATKVANEKIEQAIADYAEKLRALSDVKVYLKPS
jgi:parvulin-like peptidyl-prolyl isomerase